MPKHSSHIMDLARLGAAARIKELHAEIDSIRGAFPSEFGLRGGLKKRRKVRKRHVSAAARAKMSAAQKARWAKLRAKK
jgi:hypothetical protein